MHRDANGIGMGSWLGWPGQDLTGFFKQVASTSRQQQQARCLLHALHLIRVHQRAQKKRAVAQLHQQQNAFWNFDDTEGPRSYLEKKYDKL